jgi:RNA polymerase sigma-70 factor (ECF subfamily)
MYARKLHLVKSLESDEQLLLAMARDERRAFEMLVERYANHLAAFCGRQVADPSAGEDLAQDVLIAVWGARDRFKGGDGAAWLFTFAVNRCRKHQRGWARWLGVADSTARVPPAPHPTPLEQFEDRALAQTLATMVNRLPPLQREAVLLRFDARLDYVGLPMVHARVSFAMGRSSRS